MASRETRLILLSLIVPGLGHLVARRRPVEAALFLTYSLLWGILGVVQLMTLSAHLMHVTHEAYPGIVAQVLLYAAIHPVIGAIASVGLVADMRTEASVVAAPRERGDVLEPTAGLRRA